MGAISSIRKHTLPPLGQNRRMTSLHACTSTSTSGWVEQILMRRETGPGLTGPHSTTHTGGVTRGQMELQRTVLLLTLIVVTTGMITNVLNHIPMFVKSTLIKQIKAGKPGWQ